MSCLAIIYKNKSIIATATDNWQTTLNNLYHPVDLRILQVGKDAQQHTSADAEDVTEQP